jgi:hypothetical protein
MNLKLRAPLALTLSLCSGIVLTGCDRSEVKVQRVPKDSTAETALHVEATPATPVDVHAGMNVAQSAQPQLKWTLPNSWEEKPASQMRAASFTAKGNEGQTADVSVIPLPTTGRELDLVNMWRDQMHLGHVTETDANKQTEAVTVGAGQGKLFDIASEEPIIEGKSRARMVVAMVSREGTDWFFKMTGEDAFVREQKPAFVEFLKSVIFGQPKAFASTELLSVAPANEASENKKPLDLPDGWQQLPGSDFLVAKYLIKGDGNAKADVNVGRAGGSLLANVNRWRGQIGLSAVSENDLSKLLQSVEVSGKKAALVDLAGDSTRIIAVIVPVGEQSWFYKIMGDAKIVEQQKETFMKFVRSAPFSNVP